MNHLLFHNYPGACNFEKGEYDWPDTAYDDSDDCVDLNDLHELALRLQPAPRLKVSSKAVIAEFLCRYFSKILLRWLI